MIEDIKKINKSIVHEDGSVDSFEKQLLDFMSGEFNYSYPLVVSKDSKYLSYIPMINIDYPLIMNISTIMKLQSKHHLTLSMISKCEKYIKESLFAYQSLIENTSIIIVLDKYDILTGSPYIVVVRYDKTNGSVSLNEITSFYEKNGFSRFIERTYNSNKLFFKNNERIKEKHIVCLNKLQLPKNILYALSNSYDKAIFNKCQIEEQLDNLTKSLNVRVVELSNPYIFSNEEYYFGYEIYDGSKLIACGQDCIEGLSVTKDTIVTEIMDNIEHYLLKPKISEFGKIMQYCYRTCIECESGMCFLETEYMDEYSEEDIQTFLKEIEMLELSSQGIIEYYETVEEAIETGEAFATCYGALGNYFNNI